MFFVKVTVNRDRLVQRGAQEVTKNFDDLRDWYQKHRQAHKLIGVYTVIPSGMSGYSIWNVDTPVELDKLLSDHPLTGAIDTEIIAVTDQFDQQIDHAKSVAPHFR
jgi:muconolactone delta-isomerase